jgi:molybdate transport system regulatory protein
LFIHIDSVYKHYATYTQNTMLTHKRHKPSCKIWIEYEGKPLLGKGGAQILEQIREEESISRAAEKLGMSYRYVWSYLQKTEKALGEPIVETHRGGKSGGGGARLTKVGESLLDEYRRVEGYLGDVLSDIEHWEAVGLKISARNRFKGKVLAVEKDAVTAKVKVEITAPAVVTALISREAVEELEIKVGDEVEAVVKATEVMIAK